MNCPPTQLCCALFILLVSFYPICTCLMPFSWTLNSSFSYYFLFPESKNKDNRRQQPHLSSLEVSYYRHISQMQFVTDMTGHVGTFNRSCTLRQKNTRLLLLFKKANGYSFSELYRRQHVQRNEMYLHMTKRHGLMSSQILPTDLS